MKLTKAKLIAKVKAPLEKLGYIFFKDPISSAQGFFSKKLERERNEILNQRNITRTFTSIVRGNEKMDWDRFWWSKEKESNSRKADSS